MPNNHLTWDDISRLGNPTKSPQIKVAIKRLKKLEVRHKGKASMARRALTVEEYRLLHDILRNSNNKLKNLAFQPLWHSNST
jgi:hypothetical protein